MNRSLRYFLIFFAIIVSVGAIARIYYYLTDDFRLGNITQEMPYHPEWNVSQPNSDEEQQLESILKQPYRYLGKGAQSYVFVSADGQYVLKFFKFKHLRPNPYLEWLPAVGPIRTYLEELRQRKERKLNGVFQSYLLAFNRDRDESGLVFIQLNTKENRSRTVNILDKLGFHYEIALQDYPFILQKRGVTLDATLDQLLKKSDVETAKKKISLIFGLYAHEYQKGLFDHDHGVDRNTGFIGDQPIHLDVGKLLADESMKDNAIAYKDARLVGEKMKEWIKKHYSRYYGELSAHIDLTIDRLFKKPFTATCNLLYPPICFHCEETLNCTSEIFCSDCLPKLIPIQKEERCPFCFSSDFNPIQAKCCVICRSEPLPLKAIGAVFDYEGPAASLIRHLKYGGQTHLAKGCGAYLAYQHAQLGWSLPDLIVPMPMPFLRKFDRGYNQSLLLAESLAQFIDRPVVELLHRKALGFSQAGLDMSQRKALSHFDFSIRDHSPIYYDKSILLVDDVMTTGSSLRACAETLTALYPTEIRGLTLCRAI